MTATELGQGIAEGVIDPVALTETYLAAIEAHDLTPRIYARLTKERALDEARAAAQRAQSGRRLSALDGVPISWKDLFDTAGTATEAGSAFLTGRVPETDAEVLKNATAAGLICLGKTHMTELAFSGLGYNPITESPPCVNDLEAVAGGSSSGAATSVSFGLAAAGIGSDTGGSVRIPAVWNDLVGLKTTSGDLSLEGVVPLCESFDTVGPLCRSVSDAALLYAALGDTKPVDLTGANLSGCRFVVCETVALDGVEEQPQAAFDAALDRLKGAGATIERAVFPMVSEAMGLAGCLFTTEAYATWRDPIEATPEKMYEGVLKRFESGADYSGADFVAGWQRLRQLRKDWAAAVAGYDAVLTPTTPIMPPNLSRLIEDFDYFVDRNLLALRNTRIGNLMGLCALTLPTGTPSCGLQVLAPAFGEAKLLRLGAAIEGALT